MPGRRRLKIASLGLGWVAVASVVLALVTVPSVAVAHDGVDHGTEAGAADALDWHDYEKVTLTKDIGEPIDLAVLPDGRVLHTARNGVVRLTTPDTGVTKVAGTFDVYNNSEDGLQTVTLDPDFARNGKIHRAWRITAAAG